MQIIRFLKMQKIFSLIIILLMLTFSALAKNIIKVNFPGAEGKTAVIWTYKDLISMDRVVVSKEKIDSKGNFSFKTYNKHIQGYYIEVRYFRISFLMEKNTDYNIQINKVDFSIRDFYPKTVVGYLSPQFKISCTKKHEVNSELDSLNIIFDDFVNKNHLALRLGHKSWQLIDTLEADAKAYLKKHSNPYLKDFVEIQLAQFRKLSNQFGDDYIVATYFNPKKIAYSNPAYMSYFNSFWTKYINSRLRNSIHKRLDSVINKERSYQALSALVAEDTFLANPVLRELVILRNIPQLYKNKKYNKKALINILFDISASKYSAVHRQIAVNIRKRLQRLDAGNKAPDFTFIDNKGDTIILSKIKDKFVYIQFFDDECISCLNEMKYTKELYEEFDDIIEFIHISLDRSKVDMMKMINTEEYKWHFIFLEDNYEFIQNYQLSALPRAVLIDKDGTFLAWNAILPSEYFKDSFLKMLNDLKGNLKQKSLSDGIRKVE